MYFWSGLARNAAVEEMTPTSVGEQVEEHATATAATRVVVYVSMMI